MKYRVNLYREREERALRLKRGLIRGVALGVVVGLELVLVGLLVVSGFEMRSRAHELTRSASAVESRIDHVSDNPEYWEARRLVQARLDRVDFAALLHSINQAMSDEVILTEVRGGRGGNLGRVDGLELSGRVRGGEGDLSPVFAFMEALRADSVLTAVYPVIDLGKAKGQANNFRITCRPDGERKAS